MPPLPPHSLHPLTVQEIIGVSNQATSLLESHLANSTGTCSWEVWITSLQKLKQITF